MPCQFYSLDCVFNGLLHQETLESRDSSKGYLLGIKNKAYATGDRKSLNDGKAVG